MKILRIGLTFLFLALGGAQAPVTARTDTLRFSLEEAIRMARQQNPAFLAVRNDESIANWEVRDAYASLLPSASIGGVISWQGSGEQRFGSVTLAENLPSYYLSSYNLGVSYQLSGATLLAPSIARARRQAIAAQISAAEVNLVDAVTRAYLQVLRYRDGHRLAGIRLERARFNLRLAQTQNEVGTVTQLDVRQAEVQVGRAEVAQLQVGNALSTARLRLLQHIGIGVDRPLVLTTVFEFKAPHWDHESLLTTALRQNPVLLAHTATLDASRVQVRQAGSAYLPTVTAHAGISGRTRQASSTTRLIAEARAQIVGQAEQCERFNRIYARLSDPLPLQNCEAFRFTDETRNRIVTENSAFPFNFSHEPTSASLAISFPIFQGLGRERQLEAARVQRLDAEFLVREQRIALVTDLTIGLRTVAMAYQTATLEANNREVAEEQLRLARERYRLGAISFVDLVDAETVKVEADQAYVNAEYAYHEAVVQLEAVVGIQLRD